VRDNREKKSFIEIFQRQWEMNFVHASPKKEPFYASVSEECRGKKVLPLRKCPRRGEGIQRVKAL